MGLKGIYCLLIFLGKEKTLNFGKSSESFKKGYYIYVGSALNGLYPRISRHLRKEKKLHWHIDRLLTLKDARVTKIYYLETKEKQECGTAKYMHSRSKEIKGFGNSDCTCSSHLFYLGMKVDSSINHGLTDFLGLTELDPEGVKKLEKKG